MKYCEYCGKEILKHKKESWAQFDIKKYCGKDCQHKARIKTPPEKYCAYCNKKLEIKIRPNGRREPPSEMSKRKFCDLYCQTKSYRAKFNIKYCLYCGGELKRRKNEASVTFRSRQYCNHNCYSKDLLKEDPADNTRYRRLQNSREKKYCVVCGITENLHNHHIDKDLKNESDDNIVTICASCHTRVHAILRKWERQDAELRC